MSEPALLLAGAALVGVGATLVLDLWALLLRGVFGVVPSDYAMVGRWILHMPAGVFRHAKIASSAPKRGERAVGWVAHYLTGVVYAVAFVAIWGAGWLRQPVPLPALIFGVATVVMPFLIMQPAFGLGVAASRTPSPAQARLRSLMSHTAFGAGLYLSGLLVGVVL